MALQQPDPNHRMCPNTPLKNFSIFEDGVCDGHKGRDVCYPWMVLYSTHLQTTKVIKLKSQ
jgi:hypothetical protein